MGDRSGGLLRALDERCRSCVVNSPRREATTRPRPLTRGDQPSMRRPLRPAILDPYAAPVSRAILNGPPCRGAGTAPATTALPPEFGPKHGTDSPVSAQAPTPSTLKWGYAALQITLRAAGCYGPMRRHR